VWPVMAPWMTDTRSQLEIVAGAQAPRASPSFPFRKSIPTQPTNCPELRAGRRFSRVRQHVLGDLDGNTN
jgi:hypothetical protein